MQGVAEAIDQGIVVTFFDEPGDYELVVTGRCLGLIPIRNM